MYRFLRRAPPALAAAGVTTWAAVTTSNDDWDDYFPPAPAAAKKEKIVILGSGWAGLNALRKASGPGKDVTVVSPRPHFVYTPLLAGSAVGTVSRDAVREPLRALVEAADARADRAAFVRAETRDVDLGRKVVVATTNGEDRRELAYDKLVVAVGSEPATFGIPGVAAHALFLKEASDAAAVHARLLSNLEKAAALLACGAAPAEVDRLLKVVVVGGGPTGVEFAAELADFTRDDVARRYGADVAGRVRVELVEAMPRILAPFDASLAAVARDHLESRGVVVRTGEAITRLADGAATFCPSTPRTASADQKAAALARAATEDVGAVVWAAGITARPLVKKLAQKLGQTDMRGLIVDEALKVKNADGVYAIGDAALSGFAPTAQVASQQGKHVGRCLRDGADAPFAYRHAGSLCCLGTGNAVAQLAPPKSASFLAWRALHGAAGTNAVGADGEQRAVTGAPAFALWRSLYFTQLLSANTRAKVSADWLQTQISGRDIVEPVLQRRASPAATP